MNSFIHFGCWNNKRCDIEKSENGMSLVIKELLKKPSPNFYIIAGDNYYPEKITTKDKKIKILNIDNLKSGFHCISLLNEKAPVYMLMGNHDLQYENSLYNNNRELINKCSIIDEEIKYKEIFNFDRYHTLLGNTLILFLNSIFYTADKDSSLDCFQLYRPNYPSYIYDSIEKIKNFEENILRFLAEIYLSKEKKIENIIIVAHDPILSRRTKINKENGKKKEIRTPLLEDGLIFLENIYDFFPEANKYYLCADVHQYQEGIIKLGENEIYQYVVGTGGADCDEECSPLEDNFFPNVDDPNYFGFTNTQLSFKLIRCERSFGYLECILKDNNELDFQYHRVSHCEIDKKGRGKIKNRLTKKKYVKKMKTNKKYVKKK